MVSIEKIRFINNYNPLKGGTLNESEIQSQPLMLYNGLVVLRHDSNEKITNGVVNSGGRNKNSYSSNTDADNYFWASEKIGRDNSNYGRYHYYAFVQPDLIYDMDENPKQYKSVKEAVDNEQYVSRSWHDGAVVVVSNKPTPIQYIKSDRDGTTIGGVFDAKWKLIKSGVKYPENPRRNKEIAKKIKPKYRDIEVPDFLGGYSFSDLIQ